MAFFHFLAASITASIMASSTLAHSSPVSFETPTISSAPAVLPYPPLVSPDAELPPDIAPLLPSPGGSAHSPTKSSSMPTIPSTRSVNPDATGSKVPDSAFAPSGQLQDSSSLSQSVVKAFYSCLAVASLVFFI